MATSREVIQPRNPQLNLPKNLNLPYSVGIKTDGLIFLSGMVAVDPETGERKQGTVVSESSQILANLADILESARSSLANVLKINVFLYSMLELENMNSVYRAFFPDNPPARNVSGVTLDSGMKVEMECIAFAEGEIEHARSRSVVEPKNPLLNNSRRHNRPHSPGIRIGNLVFLSGMVPIDPSTGEGRLGSTAEQVHLVLSNMAHLLESAGTSMDRVIKLNVTLASMLEGETFYRVMREFFPKNPPACTVVGMQLGNGHGVEIECVAAV